MPRPRRFISDNYPVPIAQEARLAPGPVWMRAESHNPSLPEFDPRTSELIVVAIPTTLSRPTEKSSNKFEHKHL
jgi:hypothetical protein